MRIKNIEARCHKKLMDWTNTLPDTLRSRVAENCIIAGGAIASLLKDTEPKDYDVYLTDGDVLKDLAQHYIEMFCQDPPARFVNSKVTNVCLNTRPTDPAWYRYWNDHIREDTPKDPNAIDPSMPEHPRYRIWIQSAGAASATEEQETYNYFEGCPDNATTLYIQSLRNVQPTEEGKETKTTRLLNAELDALAEEATEDDAEAEPIEIGAASKKGLLRDKYVPVFLTDNCISLSGGVQIVIRFWGRPGYILNSFDFLHTKQYYQLHFGLVLNQTALESLLTNELRYTGSYYPVCSLFRLRKFLSRGMTVSAGTILQIAMDVAELNLTDIPVLYEQLIGVDAAYFIDFLHRLAKVKEAEPNFKFDKCYLMQLVDEVFNEAAVEGDQQ